MLKEKIHKAVTSFFSMLKRRAFLILIRILRILPYKRNRIVFSSFIGKSYSCNPRAIYEYLLNHYGDRFEYVWLFDYEENPEIPPIVSEHAKCVQTKSLKGRYYKATSGFWVFNHRNTFYFFKKKGQFYLQTWHGDIGFKGFDGRVYPKTGKPQSVFYQKCLRDAALVDAILVGSDWGEENMRQSFFCPEKEYWKCGYPRTDVLFHPERSDAFQQVRARYGLSQETKICLYAPTFRPGFQIDELIFSDGQNKFEQIIQALENRFGGEWVVFMRVHPACLNIEREKHYAFGDRVIDASEYPDMRDLLVASDALITDYSSTSFEFSLTYKPCWLYMEDFDEYRKKTKIVMDISSVRFDQCMDFARLLQSIQKFDEAEYRKNVDQMRQDFGSHETGTACQYVADKFIEIMGK